MRIVITTTLNDNLFHAKLIPLVRSRDDLELVVVSDRQGPRHERIKWVWPRGIWRTLGRLGGRLPLLFREILNPRTKLVMAYNVIPHGLFAMPFAWLKDVPLYLHFIAGSAEIKFAHNKDVVDNRIIARSRHPERLERISRYVSLHADRIFIPGSNTEDFLLKEGFRAEQLIRLHSTIDPDLYFPPASENRDIDILVAAQLRERKRPLFILEVFREILSRRPETKFCWLGDGGMREEFAQALDRLDLREAVRWTQTNDVAEFYRRAKIFMLCSLNEGLSLASMEAMACGMVPIAADCGDMSDTVINDRTGVLLPMDSLRDGFADAALELLEKQERWSAFSRNSIEIIRSEHSFESAITAWAEILSEL